MQQQLGRRRWNQLVRQQDGGAPHQARMVMEWLDGLFGQRMLALKSVRGDSWAPSSHDMNPADFFLRGYLKEKVYSPPPITIPTLKRKIRAEFSRIPEVMVKTAVRSMKKRSCLMMLEGGRQFRCVN